MVLPWKDLDARLDDIYESSRADLDDASSNEGETEEDEGKAARQEKTGCIIEAGFQLYTHQGQGRASTVVHVLKLHCLGAHDPYG